ncbi:hypothetical protein EK21DRAFT_115234 [Setomelanomma holmii]|uniref:Uncharacterized protein n=1 Tax=Setomelanomma holmii TaxID=210430 RepID=A0A9P4H5E1_9PLEO|nr:hypothetical protein EK21DRAFT_115234 [Setomelanomma holmii]
MTVVSSSSSSPSSTQILTLLSSTKTSTIASTSTCYSAPTNYLTNPGFEATTSWGSATNPWVLDAPSTQWSAGSTGSYSLSMYRYSGSRGFAAYSSNYTAVLTLEQTVTIPVGVKVKVGGYVKNLRGVSSTATQPLSFVLSLDDSPVYTYSPSNAGSSWTEVKPSTNSFLAGATTSTHTFTFQVSSKLTATSDKSAYIFAADDFYVTPLSGPNGEKIC